MSSFVSGTGKAIVTDSLKTKESKETYVQALLDLKDKYDKILGAAFNKDKTFVHALNQVRSAKLIVLLFELISFAFSRSSSSST